jgi:hypothetical protein
MGFHFHGRGLLALFAGLVISGAASAQDPVTVTKPGAAAAVGTSPYATYAPVTQQPASSSWFHAHLNREGHHCASNVGYYGCGSCRADCIFVFGSCRAFFGEPCFPEGGLGQRGQASGYNADGRGSCGCR